MFASKSKIAWKDFYFVLKQHIRLETCEFFIRSSQDRLERLQMTCRRENKLKLLIHLRSITGLSWQTMKLDSKRLTEEDNYFQARWFRQLSILNSFVIKALNNRYMYKILYYIYYLSLLLLYISYYFKFLYFSISFEKDSFEKGTACVLCYERTS